MWPRALSMRGWHPGLLFPVLGFPQPYVHLFVVGVIWLALAQVLLSITRRNSRKKCGWKQESNIFLNKSKIYSQEVSARNESERSWEWIPNKAWAILSCSLVLGMISARSLLSIQRTWSLSWDLRTTHCCAPFGKSWECHCIRCVLGARMLAMINVILVTFLEWSKGHHRIQPATLLGVSTYCYFYVCNFLWLVVLTIQKAGQGAQWSILAGAQWVVFCMGAGCW